MSMINDTHQFVFLHVAKTGGRSIQLSLQKRFGREGVFHTGNIDLDINRHGLHRVEMAVKKTYQRPS
jgi:hypothetical protein